MTIQARRTATRRPRPDTTWERDAARLLALLEDNPDGAVTLAEMHERGIDAPAQLVYALQLAGYDIDRAPIDGDPRGPLGYRLRSTRAVMDEPSRHTATSSDEP